MSVSKNVVIFAGDKSINGAAYSDNRFIAFIEKLADVLLQIELFWVIAAAVYVYISLMAIVPSGYYSWFALGVSFMPFIMRRLRRGYFSARTAFDIPIFIFMMGAIIGLVYSVDTALSLKVFQSCLAGVVAYYAIINYRHPRLTLVFLLLFAVSLGLIILIFTIGNGRVESEGISPMNIWLNKLVRYAPQFPQPADHVNPVFSWVYNAALLPIIIMPIMIGMILFNRRWYLRAISLVFFLCMLFIVLATVGNGLVRLVEGETLTSRMPLWKDTLSAIGNTSWFVGLGLGMPLLYTQGVFQDWLTHPHNSYIELYANTGILGLVSAFISFVIVIRLGYKLIRSSRINGWYGFTFGLLFAVLVVGLFGIFTTSFSGYIAQSHEGYYYVTSLLPWWLGACILVSYKLTQESHVSK